MLTANWNKRLESSLTQSRAYFRNLNRWLVATLVTVSLLFSRFRQIIILLVIIIKTRIKFSQTFHVPSCPLLLLHISSIRVIRCLRSVIVGSVQKATTSLVENTPTVSVTVNSSFRCLSRLFLFKLLEVLFSVLRFASFLVKEIVIRCVVIRLLSMRVLHFRGFILKLFLLILVALFFIILGTLLLWSFDSFDHTLSTLLFGNFANFTFVLLLTLFGVSFPSHRHRHNLASCWVVYVPIYRLRLFLLQLSFRRFILFGIVSRLFIKIKCFPLRNVLLWFVTFIIAFVILRARRNGTIWILLLVWGGWLLNFWGFRIFLSLWGFRLDFRGHGESI